MIPLICNNCIDAVHKLPAVISHKQKSRVMSSLNKGSYLKSINRIPSNESMNK